MYNSEVAGPRVPERDLRRWLTKALDGAFHSFIEPSHGSTPGAPDVLVLLPGCREFLPVELKIAHEKKKRPDWIRPEDIRAAQINWHVRVNTAGGWSCFLFGVPRPDEGFDAYVLAHCSLTRLRSWRLGYPKSFLTCVSRDNLLDVVAWEQAMKQERIESYETPVPDFKRLPKRAMGVKRPPIPELNLSEWLEAVSPEQKPPPL